MNRGRKKTNTNYSNGNHSKSLYQAYDKNKKVEQRIESANSISVNPIINSSRESVAQQRMVRSESGNDAEQFDCSFMVKNTISNNSNVRHQHRYFDRLGSNC